MKSKINKYLDANREFRIYILEANQNSVEDDLISLSSISSLLLSQDERITFYFKSESGDKLLKSDIYSDNHFTYKISDYNINRGLLFVTKSKLKNFGASYNTILDYHSLNLIEIFEDYYKQSEQMEVSIFRVGNHIVLIQPLPFFDTKNYEQLKRSFSNNVEMSLKDCVSTGSVITSYQKQV